MNIYNMEKELWEKVELMKMVCIVDPWPCVATWNQFTTLCFIIINFILYYNKGRKAISSPDVNCLDKGGGKWSISVM